MKQIHNVTRMRVEAFRDAAKAAGIPKDRFHNEEFEFHSVE